jgi:diguanylate cyclase (GGDEF)-like protein
MTESAPNPKVLVVDDQPANIQILAEALQSQYDVRIATNGEKALQIAHESDKPDLILLDVMMPDLDGFEVCRRLKSDPATQHIPVIFVTAKDNASDEERGLSIGAIDYISKPFSIPVVRARVRNHIQLKQRADLLEELASIDPLTHLPNRRLFESTLLDEWKRAQREGATLSILLADVDYFKNYNDHYGHGAGDICLQRVAGAMQSRQSRPGDMVARFGGEEFIVILPNTDREGAKVAGERLCKRIEKLQIPHAYSSAAPVVSISIGCATMSPLLDDIDPSVLINAADSRLYLAKDHGRNRVA